MIERGEMRQLPRQPLAVSRAQLLNVVSFKRMDWNRILARVIDASPLGVGIESAYKTEPGFVWFPHKLDGYRGGLLMWSRQFDDTYRAGIKLVALSPDYEQSIERRIAEEGSLRDPMMIADTILGSLKKRGEHFIVSR